MSEVATPFSRLKATTAVIYYQITLFCDRGIGVLLDNMLSVYIYQLSNGLDDLHGIHQVEMCPPEWDGPAV
ncbi:hypothetical protein NC652_002948 [Populus alba x Populus x berolinensis]|nr:hypothetical protein NC652_002948 [Populus alba x Populus x berolinensis]